MQIYVLHRKKEVERHKVQLKQQNDACKNKQQLNNIYIV